MPWYSVLKIPFLCNSGTTSSIKTSNIDFLQITQNCDILVITESKYDGELPDNFIKFHDLPSSISGCNVIDNIPTYLSVSYNFKRLYLVQAIVIDSVIEYNEIAVFYCTYEFTSGLNKGTTFDLSKYGATQLGPFGLKTTGVTNKPLGTKFLDSTPDFASIGMTPVALQALGSNDV